MLDQLVESRSHAGEDRMRLLNIEHPLLHRHEHDIDIIPIDHEIRGIGQHLMVLRNVVQQSCRYQLLLGVDVWETPNEVAQRLEKLVQG